MAIKTKQLKRVFRYGGTDIPDPLPGASPERVLEVLSATYPTLTNADIEGPSHEDGKLVFMVKVNIGTKG